MASPTPSPKTNRRLRRGIVTILALLALQFVIGMYLNLFVELPKVHPGSASSYAPSVPWALAGGAGLALALHVLLWIALTIGGLALLTLGIMSRRKVLIAGTALGFVFLLSAGSGGLTFLNAGGEDRASFEMAISFIMAMIAYALSFRSATGATGATSPTAH